jgi:hypothetical protein
MEALLILSMAATTASATTSIPKTTPAKTATLLDISVDGFPTQVLWTEEWPLNSYYTFDLDAGLLVGFDAADTLRPSNNGVGDGWSDVLEVPGTGGNFTIEFLSTEALLEVDRDVAIPLTAISSNTYVPDSYPEYTEFRGFQMSVMVTGPTESVLINSSTGDLPLDTGLNPQRGWQDWTLTTEERAGVETPVFLDAGQVHHIRWDGSGIVIPSIIVDGVIFDLGLNSVFGWWTDWDVDLPEPSSRMILGTGIMIVAVWCLYMGRRKAL